MDDECVQELGRPLSTMKVTELRDELTRRNLTKSGNKAELIDRLRSSIQRLSSQSSTLDAPQDVALTQESAKDLPQYQNEAQDLSFQTAAEPINLQARDPIIEAQPSIEAQENANREFKNDVIASEINEAPADLDKINEDLQSSIQPEAVSLDAKFDEHPEPETSPEQLVSDEQIPPIDEMPTEQESSQQNEDQAQLQSKIELPLESTEIAQNEPSVETQAPTSISLKRGFNRVATASKEKRRKWSFKTETPEEKEGADVILGGISAQKLKELIVVKGIASDLNAEKECFTNETKEAIEAKAASENPEQDSPRRDDEEPQQPVGDTQSKTKTKVASEPENVPTNILLIQNLVRPFTLTQLKEVLTENGPIDDDKFWIDKVKSKCCVIYENIEIAKLAKQSLHGRQWPTSNPKTLKVQFVEEELLTTLRQSDSKPEPTTDTNENGASESTKVTDRLGEKFENQALDEPVKKRLGEKVSGEVSTKSSNVRRDSDNSEPEELDSLFKKTKTSPHIYWLPLNDEQADSMAGKRVERDNNRKAALARRRRSPPPRRRSPVVNRRGSPSPRRRSPISNRRRQLSPRRRSPSPRRRSPSPRRRSPSLRRRLPSPRRRSRSPRRRSPPSPRRRSRSSSRDRGTLLRRRSPPRRSPTRNRGGPRRRSRSPLNRRSSPSPRRRSPISRRSPINRRSPPRRRSPMDDSPPLRRRSPMRGPVGRRSPMRGIANRRSPALLRRSSPGNTRLSPGHMRRGSPGIIRRSPGPGARRSPVLVRRSPRRSPLLPRPPLSQARGSPSYGQGSPRQRSPPLRRRSPMRQPSPGRNYNMRF